MSPRQEISCHFKLIFQDFEYFLSLVLQEFRFLWWKLILGLNGNIPNTYNIVWIQGFDSNLFVFYQTARFRS